MSESLIKHRMAAIRCSVFLDIVTLFNKTRRLTNRYHKYFGFFLWVKRLMFTWVN